MPYKPTKKTCKCGKEYIWNPRRKEMCTSCAKTAGQRKRYGLPPIVPQACACGTVFVCARGRKYKTLCTECAKKEGVKNRAETMANPAYTRPAIKEAIDLNAALNESEIARNNLAVVLRDLLAKTAELGDAIGRKHESALERNSRRTLLEYGPDWARKGQDAEAQEDQQGQPQ